MTTPADRAQLLMWRILLRSDAVQDYRAAAHDLLAIADRLEAEVERLELDRQRLESDGLYVWQAPREDGLNLAPKSAQLVRGLDA